MKRCGQLASIFSLLLLLCCSGLSVAQRTTAGDERRSVIDAFSRFFGKPTDATTLSFDAKPYVITPTFSEPGLLLSLRIDLDSGVNSGDISRSDFDRLLTLLDSVKPLGKYEESDATIMHGGRDHVSKRYENGYLYTTESIGPLPHAVQSASVFYLHAVSGIATLPTASKLEPGFECSFCMVCVNGEAYTAPNTEFQRVALRSKDVQPFNLAGPMGDQSSCTKKPDPAAEKPTGGVVGGIISSVPVLGPSGGKAQRVRISSKLADQNVINKVQPTYPATARDAHVQGSCVLKVLIDKKGKVSDVTAISGDPLLVPAAMDAVKQWRFKPYSINGQAVAVETRVIVSVEPQ